MRMHTLTKHLVSKSKVTVALNLLLIFISCVKQATSSKALKDIEIKAGEPIPTIELGDTPYILFRKSLSWMDARRVCETTVGRLAVFENEDAGLDAIYEIETISIPYTESYDRGEYEYELGMDRRYWFGLADIGLEGDWRWMDDGRQLAFNTLWYPNQPDHVKDHKLEHCAALWNPIYYLRETHSWNDEPCENKLYFICESYPFSKTKRKQKPAPETTTEKATTNLPPEPMIFTTENILPDPPITTNDPQIAFTDKITEKLTTVAVTTPIAELTTPLAQERITQDPVRPSVPDEGIYATPMPCTQADPAACLDYRRASFV